MDWLDCFDLMDFADADNERLAVAELAAEEEDHYGL